jgi:hypothetical protein
MGTALCLGSFVVSIVPLQEPSALTKVERFSDQCMSCFPTWTIS